MGRAFIGIFLICACAGRVAPHETDPIVAKFRERAGAAEIRQFERLKASADAADLTRAVELVLFRLTDDELFEIGITQVDDEWAVAWTTSDEALGPTLIALKDGGLDCGVSAGLGCAGIYVPKQRFFEARSALLAAPDVRRCVESRTVRVVEPSFCLR